ncbi:YceI family protein [Sphingomonas sp. MMS24-J13]|uniref:YceI family protein n=1 Tax=Sphingomonas sp. MMS24-J13 TaxID=3238686 RepID=UPI00385020F2
MRAAFLAFALIATPVLAQAPANIPSGTYAVDTGHTQVLFTVMHLGISEYTGQFTQPTGSLTLDTAHPANSKVEVTFPIAKVSTTVPALDAHLKTADFFDAAKFPDGKFVSTKVVVNGTNATITGDLTLKGVTKPVVLQAHFTGGGPHPMTKKPNVGFSATTVVKRSDFGVSYGIPMISDDVKLTINAAFAQQ